MSMTPNERRRIDLMNDVGLSFDQATKIIKMVDLWKHPPRTSIARSRTFQGIADAMAEQWGKLPITVTMDCESK